ncbi:glycosyltransferase 87 family protein [Streptomyces sp. NBC_00344]|uniref:glycosyltransferase 87 family protein n=1 Tax=Streptomyces sp. NBC_00344 TaxID=2975720 RepID=UPI002E1CD291
MTIQQLRPPLRPAERGTVRPWPAVGALWVLTRLGMIWLLAHDSLGIGGVATEVHTLYRSWYAQLGQGSYPVGDVTWQYPPGAGAVILSPALLPFLTYVQAFTTLVLATDAVVTFALLRAGGTGVWMWVCGLPLLLHIPLARYDVQVTALAVLGLLALRRRPVLGGALAGLGAMVKVWPALTLLGTPRGRTTRAAWLSAACAAAVLLTVLALCFSHPLGFLRQQSGRGVQIESIGGTALALAHRAGWPGTVVYRYGALEFTGPHVQAVGRAALALTAAAFCWLLLWRMKAARWTDATPFDSALCAVLLFTVTSRVISPQYLIWLIGLAAVCLTSARTTQRPVAVLLLPAAAASSLAYPVLYTDVAEGSPLGCTLMVVRNGLLLAAALLSARRLWAATVPAGGARWTMRRRPPAARCPQ